MKQMYSSDACAGSVLDCAAHLHRDPPVSICARLLQQAHPHMSCSCGDVPCWLVCSRFCGRPAPCITPHNPLSFSPTSRFAGTRRAAGSRHAAQQTAAATPGPR